MSTSVQASTTPPTPPTPAPPVRAAGPFISRDFALLWSGQTISILGDFVFNTALLVWIGAVLARGASWAPLAVSGVLVAAAAPAVLIGPLAGVFVDRWDHRRTMLAMDAIRMGVVALLIPVAIGIPLPLAPSGRLPVAWTLGLLYGGVFVIGACEQFFRPATLALLGGLVEEPLRPRAMGMLQGAVSVGMLVGPAVAPPLLLFFGPVWALLINAASFAVSFATIWALRRPRDLTAAQEGKAPRRGFARELAAGAHFLLRSRVLRTLVMTSAIAMLGAGTLNVLDIFFTTQNLHTPVALYGLLNTALGVGLIAGSVLGVVFAQRIGLARMLCGSILVVGAFVVLYARLTSFGPAAVVLLLTGVPLAAIDVASGPLLLREAPAEMVGRVSSLMNPVVTVAALAGSALAGWLDGVVLRGFSVTALGLHFGPVDTIYMAAGVLIAASGVYALMELQGADGGTRDTTASTTTRGGDAHADAA